MAIWCKFCMSLLISFFGINRFSNCSIDWSWKFLYTRCNGNEGVNVPTGCLECLYEWVIFGRFFVDCSMW